MKIEFDPTKRDITLAERGFDFATDAATVFAGMTLTFRDARWDYGEARFQTYGLLNDRMVMVVWTARGDARHIMSMRKCNEREQTKFGKQLDRSR